MRKCFLLISMFSLLSGMAFANNGVIVNFPSDNTWYSTASNGSDYFGNNGGFSAPMGTAGDFITETFVTGQTFVNSLTLDWTVVDFFGNNPAASYENDIYLNGTFVGYFLVDDCGSCANVYPVTGSVSFNPIYGFGTYSLSVVLSQTAPANGGSEWFTEFNAAGSQANALLGTPEPSSIVLFGSGLFGLAKMLRRKKP